MAIIETFGTLDLLLNIAVKAKNLAELNDRKVQAAAAEIDSELIAEIHRMLSEIHETYHWGKQPEKERPTEADLLDAVYAYYRAYRRSGNPRKRELLKRAFHRNFDPQFFRDGMNRILWGIVERLDYPDFVFLERVFSGKTAVQPLAIRPEGSDYLHAKRLDAEGVVAIRGTGTNCMEITLVLGLVESLQKFAWEKTPGEDHE